VDVRKVYSGPLTYAANWDTYHKIAFWNELDFIGVNAYFPLVTAKTAGVDELKKAWLPIKKELNQFSDQFKRPILFTEYGYRSANNATGNQWEIKRNAPVNHQAQVNGYAAFYKIFWNEKWVAGGFAWKWHFRRNVDPSSNSAYTLQNKPAMKVLKKAYRK
jgi:hypothetical protein